MLQIRQAETALKDGRLDEAFELARAEKVQAHRRGQKLIGRLVRALAARGREHLTAGRLTQAAADVEKTTKLGGNLSEAAALRAAIAEAMQARQQADRRRADAVAAAREHIENGRLSVGQRLLADIEDDDRPGEALQDEAAARRAASEAALARARTALERDDWVGAIDALLEARQAHASNQQVAELMARTVDLGVQQAGLAIDQGRLDLAGSMVHRLEPLASQAVQVQELARLIRECRRAAGCVDRGQPRQAVEILRRVSSVRPGARWLSEACGHAEQAAQSLEHLRSGPLGLVSGAGMQLPDDGRPDDATVPIPRVSPDLKSGGHAVGAAIPRRFMIHVDGVGSFLVLRDRRVTIGPARSSGHADVGLLADSGLPLATIERMDEDYFLSSEVPVRVNDAPVTRKLLSRGDRIALGPRCLMKFTLPNAASTSAVIHLSGTRLPSGDARRVILMDRSIILGPGSLAHIRAERLSESAVLHVRDGRLFVRSRTEVMVNDRPMDRNAGIALGANVRIGPISFAVTALNSASRQ